MTAQNEEDADLLNQALLQYPLEEREVWRAEAMRLSRLVSEYATIKPKRRYNPKTGKHEFTPEVRQLCEQVRCAEPQILLREPHRARTVSPHTLDDWLRGWIEKGLVTFLRKPHSRPLAREDRRCARMSEAAVAFINDNWRRFRSPRALYRARAQESGKRGWVIPGESWLYRRWREMPYAVQVAVLEGKAAYESKCAPYVPRNYEDLAPLQVLCGDHSERDVSVLFDDGDAARPWLTVWQDLRTRLIWGWYLGRAPSSEASRLAYADGITNYGAQPFARPDNDFYSYIYTDRGKDYLSHDWAGKIITVHEQAMNPDGRLECFLVERRVGALEEFGIKRILARGYNAKEKPVERFFKDVSEWERNTFDEYCGSNPQTRPDKWREMYRRHQLFKQGKAIHSPFMTFDTYREKLTDFIASYHCQPHERTTLGGKRVTPLEEFRRLTAARYEIAPETVALALLKADSRVVRKGGVMCFRRDWFYRHPALSTVPEGKKVEIRFTERDYQRIWVVLPGNEVFEAPLVTPTSLLNPNKNTMKAVAQARSQEKKLIEEYQLLSQSRMLGESVEDRVDRQSGKTTQTPIGADTRQEGSIRRLTRFDRRRLKVVAFETTSLIDEIPEDLDEAAAGAERLRAKVSEFDDEEEKKSA